MTSSYFLHVPVFFLCLLWNQEGRLVIIHRWWTAAGMWEGGNPGTPVGLLLSQSLHNFLNGIIAKIVAECIYSVQA